MAGTCTAIEIVKSNHHASLPPHLRGDYLVVAIQGGAMVALRGFAVPWGDAREYAARERRLNRRLGKVSYACGFYVLQDDGSWRQN